MNVVLVKATSRWRVMRPEICFKYTVLFWPLQRRHQWANYLCSSQVWSVFNKNIWRRRCCSHAPVHRFVYTSV